MVNKKETFKVGMEVQGVVIGSGELIEGEKMQHDVSWWFKQSNNSTLWERDIIEKRRFSTGRDYYERLCFT